MIFEVQYFNVSRGYGFLKCVEPGMPSVDAFVFIRDIKDKINLQAGDLVTADVIPSKNKPGRQDAVNVVLRKRDEIAKVAQ